jgi:hypothetical protein
MAKCKDCGAPTEYCEILEDYETLCDYCNEDRIEARRKRQEWEHFHPGEPMPEREK